MPMFTTSYHLTAAEFLGHVGLCILGLAIAIGVVNAIIITYYAVYQPVGRGPIRVYTPEEQAAIEATRARLLDPR